MSTLEVRPPNRAGEAGSDSEFTALEAEAPRAFVADDEPMTDGTYTMAVPVPVPEYVMDVIKQRRRDIPSVRQGRSGVQ